MKSLLTQRKDKGNNKITFRAELGARARAGISKK